MESSSLFYWALQQAYGSVSTKDSSDWTWAEVV